MKNVRLLLLFLFLLPWSLSAAPVPYSGKVAINGLNFQGDAQFTFALRDANGTVHWRNGADANASINVPVDRGHYVVLLGGQGMNALPSNLFLDHSELYLVVKFYRADTQEWLHMLPDQRITSAPHALAAEVANLANLAKAVLPGAITKSMLAAEVLADLNATAVVSEQNNTGQIVSITRDMLPWDVLQDLNGTISRSRLSVDVLDDLNQSIKVITRDMLPWDVLQDLNGTISRSRLSVDVLDDLNQSIKVITRDMLPWDVLQDLNGTISRSRLSVDVLDDLNQSIKVITRDMLPWDVLQDLNGTITRSRLSVDVLDDLNQSIKVITRDMLPWDVLQDLNGTISRSRLSVDVLDDLNQSIKVITRDMLPWDVLQDLNGTISRSRLSADVLDDLNQSIKAITRDMLPWDVLQDLNGTISRSRLSADVLDDLNQSIKAITREMLPWDVLQDLNGTISRSRLPSDVLADLNRTITRNMLPADVLADLNSVGPAGPAGADGIITAGSVTLSMLSPQVRSDINSTITRGDLPADVLADLNRTVTATDIAANTITTAQLSESILKYLRPEITTAPQVPGLVFGGQSVTLSGGAEGKYLTYQWNRNGQPIAGATGATFVISDVNGTLHDGNYTLVVSNDFGSVTSSPTGLQVDMGMASARVVDLNATVAMQMLWVEPGTFTMGSPTTETGRSTNEAEHNVTLTKGFYLGKYEVTQAQYQAVMTGNTNSLSATPSNWPNNPNRPVDKVSWDDAQIFLTRLNAAEQAAGRLPAGWSYVLPTESEWEYACRAGTTTVYSWGNSIATSNANYDQSDISQTRDVGQYAANPWGFFDMHGNVLEWTADWHLAAYPTGSVIDSTGPESGSIRVVRGGSWSGAADGARSAYRLGYVPAFSNIHLGFRLGFKAVPDTTPPVLTLLGDANVTHAKDTAWVDPGATASDTLDGNLTNQVTITGTVDVNSTGAYVLTYSVSDAAGNDSNVTRVVNVVGIATTHVVDLNATVAMQMLWVEPETFTMGSPTTETGRNADREDEHNVTLTKGFYLGKYEVTQAQYEAVMTGNSNSLSATPSQWPNNANRPVEKVSWNDVQIFLTRLNAAEQSAGRLTAGWSYVLPTEAEWEYACRAGTTTAYSWGEDVNSTQANYNQSGISQTRDVGQYAANPWGFFDMHGNVWEWVANWYGTHPAGSLTDPTGPASGSVRIRRGGSWYDSGVYSRSAVRYDFAPDYRNFHLGFRVGYKFTGEHTVDLNSSVTLDMLWVEPGTFTMGSPTTETGRSADREDEHNVTLTNGFYLGKYEVTQAQYEAVMTGNTNSLSATPSQYSGNANRPVEKVSWNDVQIFLTRLNATEQTAGRLPSGWSYVLPTESEWEYACRAGTSTAYSWGDDINASHANWNWDGAYNTGNDAKETVNVGQYAASPWGFFDMHGNVWEWTADRYQAAYPSGNVTDPTGPASGSARVRRGGSWDGPGASLRSAKRDSNAPGTRYNFLGFRVGFKASQ